MTETHAAVNRMANAETDNTSATSTSTSSNPKPEKDRLGAVFAPTKGDTRRISLPRPI